MGHVPLSLALNGRDFTPSALAYRFYPQRVRNMWPLYGPVSGNTTVTLVGEGFDSYDTADHGRCRFASASRLEPAVDPESSCEYYDEPTLRMRTRDECTARALPVGTSGFRRRMPPPPPAGTCTDASSARCYGESVGGSSGGGARVGGAEYAGADGYVGSDGFDGSLVLSGGVLACTAPARALANASGVAVQLALNGEDYVELDGAPAHTLQLYAAPAVGAAEPQSGTGGTPLVRCAAPSARLPSRTRTHIHEHEHDMRNVHAQCACAMCMCMCMRNVHVQCMCMHAHTLPAPLALRSPPEGTSSPFPPALA
eukprot:2699548-Prymnesium_polylepis.2